MNKPKDLRHSASCDAPKQSVFRVFNCVGSGWPYVRSDIEFQISNCPTKRTFCLPQLKVEVLSLTHENDFDLGKGNFFFGGEASPLIVYGQTRKYFSQNTSSSSEFVSCACESIQFLWRCLGTALDESHCTLFVNTQ
jgi:hypothetical protein